MDGYQLLELRREVAREGLGLDSGLDDLVQLLDLRGQEGLLLDELPDPDPAGALDDEVDVSAPDLDRLEDPRCGSVAVQPFRVRVVHRGVLLADDGDGSRVLDRVIEQPQCLLAADGDRHDRVREEDAVPKRQDPKSGRELEAFPCPSYCIALPIVRLCGHFYPLSASRLVGVTNPMIMPDTRRHNDASLAGSRKGLRRQAVTPLWKQCRNQAAWISTFLGLASADFGRVISRIPSR